MWLSAALGVRNGWQLLAVTASALLLALLVNLFWIAPLYLGSAALGTGDGSRLRRITVAMPPILSAMAMLVAALAWAGLLVAIWRGMSEKVAILQTGRYLMERAAPLE